MDEKKTYYKIYSAVWKFHATHMRAADSDQWFDDLVKDKDLTFRALVKECGKQYADFIGRMLLAAEKEIERELKERQEEKDD